MITHHKVIESLRHLKRVAGYKSEELIFLVRPGVKISDTIQLLLRAEGVEVKRDQSAPIEHFYLITKKDYQKYE